MEQQIIQLVQKAEAIRQRIEERRKRSKKDLDRLLQDYDRMDMPSVERFLVRGEDKAIKLIKEKKGIGYTIKESIPPIITNRDTGFSVVTMVRPQVYQEAQKIAGMEETRASVLKIDQKALAQDQASYNEVVQNIQRLSALL